jgi:hypothetical protein
MTLRLSIRLYPGEDDDLIAWYEALTGNKSRAVKALMRAGRQAGSGGDLDLAAVRGVLEAALDDRLARLRVIGAREAGETGEEGTDHLLDGLGDDLLL